MDDVPTPTEAPLVNVLDAFAVHGVTSSFTAVADGRIRCENCHRVFAASDLAFTTQHRMEGASDPADSLLVVGGPCPECSVEGTLTVGYGPGTSEVDTAVVLALPDPEAPIDPVTQTT